MTVVATCNIANMKTWIEALESGAYEQATGALAKRFLGIPGEDLWEQPWKQPHYCCLGVGTMEAKKAGVPLRIEWSEDCDEGRGYERAYFYYKDDRGAEVAESDTLPPPVIEWLGIVSSNPELRTVDPELGIDGFIDAATANDDYNWDFYRIATALREKYGIPRPDPNQPSLI